MNRGKLLGSFFPFCSYKSMKFLKDCLKFSPNKRPTAAELLKSDFLVEHKSINVYFNRFKKKN